MLPRLKNNQKDDLCFYYNKPGRWKKIYNLFLEEEKKLKGSAATTSSIYVIKVNLSTSNILGT